MMKYVKGEVLSADHWHELFRMLSMPRGTTLERLTFGDILGAADEILTNIDGLKVNSIDTLLLITTAKLTCDLYFLCIISENLTVPTYQDTKLKVLLYKTIVRVPFFNNSK